MHFDTIIADGTVVNAGKSEKADVGIVGERIAAVGKGLAKKAKENGTRVIDAKGHYVIPGGVDVHVHLALPFCGTTSSDDYNTGTRAAARGGVTTLISAASHPARGTSPAPRRSPGHPTATPRARRS